MNNNKIVIEYLTVVILRQVCGKFNGEDFTGEIMVEHHPAICLSGDSEGHSCLRPRVQGAPHSSGILPTSHEGVHAGTASLWLYGRGEARKKFNLLVCL